MHKLHPLRTIGERLPRFNGNLSETFKSVRQPHISREARRVENTRQELMQRSGEVRTRQDRNPKQTAARLSTLALDLFASNAPDFEKAAALNETQANLLAGGLTHDEIQAIASLSFKALDSAFPEVKDNLDANNLNHEEIAARLEAIHMTTPDTSFAQALEKAWETRGNPIDPLITRTGDMVEEADKKLVLDKIRQEMSSLKANSSAGSATEKTGAGQIEKYDPFADDEEDLSK